MPELKPGESQSEWMARCVPDTEAEGNTNERAVAICLSKFEKKAKEDAPNYRPSEFEDKKCSNCRFNIDGFCELFDFNWDKGFICDAWEPMKEDSNVSEEKTIHLEEEVMASVNPGHFATSFAELEEVRDSQETIFNMQKLTGDFGMLAQNIMESPIVEDKQGAMQTLSGEFADRIEAVEETKELEDVTEWLDEKAVWTRAFINDLPDSNFLYIAPGGEKNGGGKTVPRTLRKFPYKGSTGKVDLPHLRNAIARIPQSNVPGLTATKKKSLQEKARKILAKETGEKGILDTVKGWIDELHNLIMGKKEPTVQAIKTFTAKDGKPWIVVWSTNAFKDRDEEMFQTKAIEDFVERHANDETKGEIWFWHLPASKFADIKLQSVVGRFLVEAGPFDETFVGQGFKEFFEKNPTGHPGLAPFGWGASHGFKYNPEDREDGVFEWFEKHESSVLPLDKAANPFNPGFILNKEARIVDEKLRKIWDEALGEDLVDAIVQTGETKTAELEAAGVEYKGDQPEETQEKEAVEETVEVVETEQPIEQVSEPETVEEPVVEEQKDEQPEPITREEIAEAIKMAVSALREDLKAIATEITKSEISETVDGLTEILGPMAAKVAELASSDEAKIANAVQEVPTASIASMIKSTLFSNEARVDGRTKYGKDAPEETEVTGKFPTVQGVELKLWGHKEAK